MSRSNISAKSFASLTGTAQKRAAPYLKRQRGGIIEIPNMFGILVPATVIILGWVVAHELNMYRDAIAKRRELRLKYLLEAYRNLEDSVGRNGGLPEAKRAFESAVADIQLLGTRAQIDALLPFLIEFSPNTGVSIAPVLKLLRDDLRKELNLELSVAEVHQFRFKDEL